MRELTLSFPGVNFLWLAKKGYRTSLASLRTCGLIRMVSLIEGCSHVTRNAILILHGSETG